MAFTIFTNCAVWQCIVIKIQNLFASYVWELVKEWWLKSYKTRGLQLEMTLTLSLCNFIHTCITPPLWIFSLCQPRLCDRNIHSPATLSNYMSVNMKKMLTSLSLVLSNNCRMPFWIWFFFIASQFTVSSEMHKTGNSLLIVLFCPHLFVRNLLVSLTLILGKRGANSTLVL